MKVELSIKDDHELRNLVKDMIRGEVKSVARAEIRAVIKEVFEKNFDSKKNADALFKEEVRLLVKEELKPSSGWMGEKTSFIKRVAREYVEEQIQQVFKSKEGVLK